MKLFPNALNPHMEESRALVRAMIDRVMELHRDLRWFHIGCDEVRRGPGAAVTAEHIHLNEPKYAAYVGLTVPGQPLDVLPRHLWICVEIMISFHERNLTSFNSGPCGC